MNVEATLGFPASAAWIGAVRLHQADDQVVQAGQQFIGRQIQVGQGAYGGTQPSHGGRGVDAVSDHVPDDQGDPRPGQRDHIEPVAAHTAGGIRREVPRRHLQRGSAGQLVRQQVLLHDPGRGVLAGEAARVVDTHRGPGDELLGELDVVRHEGPRSRRERKKVAAPRVMPRACTGATITERNPKARITAARTGSSVTQELVAKSRTGSTRDSPLSRQRAMGDVGERWTASPTARPASGQPSWTDC